MEALRTIDGAARKATHPQRNPLTESQANAARVRLHAVLEMFGLIEPEPAMLAQTGRLAGPLGTLDALHLATALTWQDRAGIIVTMATHDPELASAAARHGLRVIGARDRSPFGQVACSCSCAPRRFILPQHLGGQLLCEQ